MGKEKIQDLEDIAKPRPSKMLAEQYFNWYRDDIHPYRRAYIAERCGGILKTQSEWDEVLTSGI